ncbi:MAG: hypothetical protein PHY15_01360 [Eubacteriales bacterium]|nr:hypothetical protein [Eubacteriales bacterium]MDD4475055.1 hypothetical protein [Eubacteriales bacterium]
MDTNRSEYQIDNEFVEKQAETANDQVISRKYLGIYFIIVSIFAVLLNIVGAYFYASIYNPNSESNIIIRVFYALNNLLGFFNIHYIIALVCLIAAVVLGIIYKQKEKRFIKVIPACASFLVAGSIYAMIYPHPTIVLLLTVFFATITSTYIAEYDHKLYFISAVVLFAFIIDRGLQSSYYILMDKFEIPSLLVHLINERDVILSWIALLIYGVLLILKRDKTKEFEKPFRKPTKVIPAMGACARLMIISGSFLLVVDVLIILLIELKNNSDVVFTAYDIYIFNIISDIIIACGLLIISLIMARKYRPETKKEAKGFNFLFYSNIIIGLLILAGAILPFATNNIFIYFKIILPSFALIFLYLERKENEKPAVWLSILAALLPADYYLMRLRNLLSIGYIINYSLDHSFFNFGVYITVGIILLNKSRKPTQAPDRESR